MKYMTKTILLAAMLSLLTAGCYTKFYRPDMEQAGRGPYDSLYNRYDSTAIDTTLTKPEITDTYPNNDDYGWSTWGRPRGYTRWGFDFNNFTPDYYWTYYGYYDYYSRPWWDRYNDPWWYWGWNGNGTPAEPPSQRDYGRRGHPQDGGGYQAPPPSSGSGGSYVNPAPANPPADRKDNSGSKDQKQGDTNKREGRRGR